MPELSGRQADALRAIEWFTRAHGHAPTVRDIQHAIGHSSPSSTYRVLQQLRDMNYVTWEPRGFRTLRIRHVRSAR